MARIAVLATAVAAYSLKFQWSIIRARILNGMFIVDNFSVFFQWLFLIIAGVSAVLSMRFNERESINRGEYYALLLFACSGMSLMAASGDLILTFLGIEILSIATYILAGFKRNDIRSNESSLKYFLLGSFATAFLLYGIALIYGGTGSTNYQSIRELALLQGSVQSTTLIGMGLLLVGFGFKVALVPFHSWAPDVYEGAPTPVTAFMAVGPKAAGFAALIRILVQALPFSGARLELDSVASGHPDHDFGQCRRGPADQCQTHAGLFRHRSCRIHSGRNCRKQRYGIQRRPVLSRDLHGDESGGLQHRSCLSAGKGDTRVHLDDYAGLGRKAPFAAAALSLALISLAGIPLTGGFIGKFYLFSAAIQKGYIGLAMIGVLNSVVSVFYYFRVDGITCI